MDLTKSADTGCIVIILNKLIQVLSYDDTIIRAILTTNSYGCNRFSQPHDYFVTTDNW